MSGATPPVIVIEDADDPRIEPFRAVRERDIVGRDRQFIAEGEVVLRGLLRSSRHRPVSLLIAENRVARMSALLGEVPDDVPVYSAGREVMDAIAGFPMHRGILAVGQSTADPGAEALIAALPERALIMVLIGIANHDNMGGLFRNAAAFGADAVLVDGESCDPLYRKAIRVSVGAALNVPFARVETGADALSLLERQGFATLALSPSGETNLDRVQRSQLMAVLFGAEGPGLPDDILVRATSVRIPMSGGFDSLNVATSSGIVLYHLTR